MGMFDFLKKKQSSPARPSSPSQPTDKANPNKPAQAQPAPQQSADAKTNPNKPAQPPVQQPPQKKEEERVLRKYLLTMLSPDDEDARKKFCVELVRRANYVWSPHKMWGRIGVNSDNKQKLQIEVDASLKDIHTMIEWCKNNRLYPTHAIKAEERGLTHLTHTNPQFTLFIGPLH